MATPTPRVFLPGSTIGVMGGGQLGRMFAIAARRLGYRVHTFSPDEDTPTGQLADREVAASYDDEAAVRDFARGVDVLTFEFENIPSETIEWCARECVVRPSGNVLHICQHRLREKTFLREAGLPLPPFKAITSEPHLCAAVAALGTPCVLKTASFGYDGKGQHKIEADTDLTEVWASISAGVAPKAPEPDSTDLDTEIPHPEPLAVLEAWVPFAKEISVLVARGVDGEVATYPVCENRHANHILDLTVVPAAIPDHVADEARSLARSVAEKIDLVGLLAVEMFLLPDPAPEIEPGPRILINELAPRPHNSGHFSFDASITSQFEQQLRAVCGLPLGSTESFAPSAMVNLLGDLWEHGEPDWAAALSHPDVKLHLYGKTAARRGRKMGHMVAVGTSTGEASARALLARAALVRR
jgi:5-(carboxyamino)imidazole ribonucleotide synthase